MEKYAYLMVDFKTPEFIKNLQKRINKEDIYKPEKTESGFEYGIETETHATIVPCLDNDVDIEKLKKHLMPLESYKSVITDVSLFENQDYDVLKCQIFCGNLIVTNNDIKKEYKTHSEFKDYNPHVTVAYLKKGTGKKYIKSQPKDLVFLEPTNFSFGYYKDDVYTREEWK